jgi:hypothetical protein
MVKIRKENCKKYSEKYSGRKGSREGSCEEVKLSKEK